MTTAVPARPPLLDRRALLAALLAAVVVVAGHRLGWRGVDLPAQLYRVGLFRRDGFSLWDSQWFGGHWLLNYSVLFPAVAATVGVWVLTAFSAAAAAFAFDRLVVGYLRPAVRAASVVFALGVAVQSAIGQLTFLCGEAAGLWCLLLVARRRWSTAAVLALLSALVSPLDGAFVALGAAAVAVSTAAPTGTACTADGLGRWARAAAGPLAVTVAAGVPVGVLGLLFPGDGPMPYPVLDFAWEFAVAVGLWLAAGPGRPVLRRGLVLYALALIGSVSIHSPLGGNIGRAEDVVALPLAVALLWPARRLLLAVAAVPLALSQWSPAWGAMTANDAHPWTHAAYYRPMVGWLDHAPGPAGRVEVVPTADHWEAAYVAPSVPLARGWERQLDVADNPLFYRPGALAPGPYRAWLVANGVRYVALPTAPLDPAGVAERRVLTAGVPGLVPVWGNTDWRVWQVTGSRGIVGAGGRLVHLGGSRVTLVAAGPGTIPVQVRWSPSWRVVDGSATLAEAPGGWLDVTARHAGPLSLQVGLPRL